MRSKLPEKKRESGKIVFNLCHILVWFHQFPSLMCNMLPLLLLCFFLFYFFYLTIFFGLLQADVINQVVEKHSGRLPLHIAADFGQLEVLQYLIDTGADLNVRA